MTEAGNFQPGLSIVIPTMGRTILIQTLDSLVAAEGFDQLEVIVAGRVPDGRVAEQLAQTCASHPNIRHLDIQFETGDSSRKKNEGAAVAKAPLIAFLDDDVVVAPDWPLQIVEPFADSQVGLVSGPSLVPDDINRMGRLAGLTLSSRAAGYVAERYRQNQDKTYPIDWDRVIGCNAVYRREAFEQMGGFPADFYPGEEMIAAFRTEQAGWKLLFIPSAWVNHYPRQSLWRFGRQMWGYGATRIRLLRGGVSFHPLPLVPGLWVAGTGLLLGLSVFFSWARLLLLVDLGLYLTMAFLIALETVCRTRKWGDGWVWAMIPWMHLAYGTAEWAEFFHPGADFSEGTLSESSQMQELRKNPVE
jgi:cellulose synthase/poly-beta-1,6-N-acetylglucosamine synthase-like glycosyltransferase